jgi:HlyD family secretion protein
MNSCRGEKACMMRTVLGSLLAGLMLVGCGAERSADFLGSAVVEARLYQVGSSVPGVLLAVPFEEGQRVDSGQVVALIDTVGIVLKLQELDARDNQLRRQIDAQRAQLEASRTDVSGLERERNRMSGLVEQQVVASRQLDELQTRHDAAKAGLHAARLGVEGLEAQHGVVQAQRAQLLDQLARCSVIAPSKGLILTRFRNQGEVAGPGLLIYELGVDDTVQADFFVPQPLLGSLAVGQAVRVRLDTPQGEQFVPGRISWIASEAEFSPKNIQTRETRNELVFQIRARIANGGGLLKRGLPVEIWR